MCWQDLADSDEPGLPRTLVAAGVLLVVAIVFRLLAVYGLFGRWTLRDRMAKRRAGRDPRFRQAMTSAGSAGPGAAGEPLDPPTQKETLLVGWTGMRGILTLAAAVGDPADDRAR